MDGPLNTIAWQRRRIHKLSEAAVARQSSKIGLGGGNELSAAARHGRCRTLPADQEVLDFNQLVNHSTFIWRSFKIHTQRGSTFFPLQGFLSSMFTKSLNASSVLFKILNSNKYWNGQNKRGNAVSSRSHRK